MQEELLAGARRLLDGKGRFCLILPTIESSRLRMSATLFGLHLRRLTRFFTREGKGQERTLMEFQTHPGPLVEDEIILSDAEGRWSDPYRKLVGGFYLDPPSVT